MKQTWLVKCNVKRIVFLNLTDMMICIARKLVVLLICAVVIH